VNDYFDRLETHLLDAVERHARQRARPAGVLRGRLSGVDGGWRRGLGRWLRGRRPGLLALVGALVLTGSAAGAVLLSAEHSRALSGVVPPYDARGNISMAGAHYHIAIAPSLQAGTIGWCNLITFEHVRGLRGGGLGGGSCGTGTPAVGSPLFAPDGGSGGGVWYVLTSPQVAAVRVAGGPTILTRAESQLPYGYRAAVAELPRRVFTRNFPRLTALDARGEAIPGGAYEHPPQEPTRFWSYPHAPADGVCSLTARDGSDVRVKRGASLTSVVPDPGIIGHAFLSCLDVEVVAGGAELEAAVLLDAGHPGATRPAALPDMRPVPGAPGFFSRSSAEIGLATDRRMNLLARRVGDAWLVLSGADGAHQGVRTLRALTMGPVELRTPPPVPPLSANAECRIGVRALAGLREVSQTAFLVHGSRGGFPLRYRGHAEVTGCADADFYLGDWSLTVTALLPIGRPGTPPVLRGKLPLPGYPGVFTIPAEVGGTRNVVRRVGGAWLEVGGGSGAAQQALLLGRLSVSVSHARPVEFHPAGEFLAGAGGLL
jgi:hypothetical protein